MISVISISERKVIRDMKKNSWLIMLSFTLVVVLAIAVTMNMNLGGWGGKIIEDPDTPLGDLNNGPVFYVNTVGEISGYPFKEGTIIKALGLSAPDDGLMSEYKVVTENSGYMDGYTRIPLVNGNTAVLRESLTHVAYIGQFGAIGDGIADNAPAIRAALNSDYSIIVFTPGDYRANSSIVMTTGNKTVLGTSGSAVFSDNQYSDKREWFIVVRADNVVFDGVTIETRDYSTTTYKTQFCIADSRNIAVDNSTLNVFPMSTQRIYGNIDLYTGWENVRIDNCTLIIQSDGLEGSSVAIRDFSSKGARGAQITNNTMTKRSLDEIIYVTGEKAVLSDVLISDNTFTMEDSTSSSPLVALITSSGTPVKNIEFSRNTITAYGSYMFFNVYNAEDILIADNDMTFHNLAKTDNAMVFNTHNAYNPQVIPETAKNLNIVNNTITVNSQSVKVQRVFSVVGNVRNNRVTINGNVENIAARTALSFENNEVVVNGNIIGGVFLNVFTVLNNAITINGDSTRVFHYNGTSLARDAHLESNRIYIRDGRVVNSETFLYINDSKINDNTIYVQANEMICGLDDYKSYLDGVRKPVLSSIDDSMTGNTVRATASSKDRTLYQIALLDTSQQCIVFANNTFFGYQRTSVNKSLAAVNTARTINNLPGVSYSLLDAQNTRINSLASSKYVVNTVWCAAPDRVTLP